MVVPSKIKIKMGSFELEYECDELISKDSLIELVEKLAKLLPKEALKPQKAAAKTEGDDEEEETSDSSPSTSTIAQKLGVTTGPGLVKAALARLCIFEKKSAVKRKDLITEMKTATSFFDKNHVSNLTSTLDRLVSDDVINQISTGTYALSEKTVKEVKTAFNGKS